MKDVRWVIRKKEIPEEVLQKFRDTCKSLDIELEEFTDENQKITIDNKINFYYGTNTQIKKNHDLIGQPGVFFDENEFSMENYLSKWGGKMLNMYGRFTTLNEFSKELYDDESVWFLKPDADGKIFSGILLPFKKIKDWQNNIKWLDGFDPDGNTKIMISTYAIIQKEWRTFIVDGKVIASSIYRWNKEEDNIKETPEEVIKFAEDRSKEYQPSKVFTMDIALCGGQYYIVECNCINYSWPYECDIFKFVEGITNYLKNEK